MALGILGCGGGQPSAASSPSGTPTASSAADPRPSLPPSPSPAIAPVAGFGPGACTGKPAGTRTQDMGNDRLSVQVTPGWVDTSATYGPNETLLLRLTAPNGYGNSPMTFELHSMLGRFLSSTSREQAQQRAAELQQPDPYNPAANAPAVGSIFDCTVAGDQAAYFSLVRGTQVEVDYYVLHSGFLYLVRLTGNGGITATGATDMKAMLASLLFGE